MEEVKKKEEEQEEEEEVVVAFARLLDAVITESLLTESCHE